MKMVVHPWVGKILVPLALALTIATHPEGRGAQGVVPTKRIGALAGFGCGNPDTPFRKRLAALGWIDGRSLIFDCVATVSSNPDELASLAAELVARQPDVLIATPTYLVLALKRASTTIPIVMLSTPDPVENGLVTNLPRPEATVTGVATSGPDLVGKRVELLKEIVPSLSQLAIIERKVTSGDDTYYERIRKNMAAAATPLGFAWRSFVATAPEDYDGIFARIKKERFDAVYVVSNPLSL